MFKLSRYFQLASLSAAIVCFSGPPTWAAESETAASVPIVRVEEDWIAYISNPDAASGAPQITNVISPISSMTSVFGLVELNHRSGAGFNSGGYQVQAWVGDTLNDYSTSDETSRFTNNYDKLTYTVGLELNEQAIRVILKDGASRTWGRFAKEPVTAITPAYSATLEEYSPQFSVANTSINVGAHRVALMYQQQVRYYSANGLERTDDTDRLLHRFKEIVQFVSLEEYEQKLEYFNIDITEE